MFERKKKPGNRAAVADAFFKMSEDIIAQKETTFEKTMSQAILLYADTVGFDRLGVYRLIDTGIDTRFEQLYSWDREYGGTSKVKGVLNAVPLGRGTERWQKTFQDDKYINGRRKDMPHAEQDILGPFSVHGIMIVPVFVETKLWGVVTYQEHTYDRAFDENISDVMVAGAHFLADNVMKEEIIRISKVELVRLRQNKRMADALSEATVNFLSQSDRTAAEVVNASLRPIAEALNIDRITIWRNFQAADGLHTSQIYRWDIDAGGVVGAMKGLDDIAYHKFIPMWETKLKKGQAINGPSFEMPESEQLRSYGCMSIYVAPLIFNKNFWGFAMFEDKHVKRFFDKLSGDTMRQAGLFVANSIIRAELERDIAESGEFNRALLDMAPVCYAIIDDKFNVIDCNNRTQQLFECDKQFFCVNFMSLSPEIQPDGAPSAEKAKEYIQACLNGERVIFEWTHINNAGEIFNAETTLTRIRFRDRFLVLVFFRDLRNIIKVAKTSDDSSVLRKSLDESRRIISELQEQNKSLSDDLETALGALQSKTTPESNQRKEELPKYLDRRAEKPTDEPQDSPVEKKRTQDFFDIGEGDLLDLSPVEFPLDEMIKNAVMLIKNQIDTLQVVLSVHVGDGVPTHLIGDGKRLSQVTASLISRTCLDASPDSRIEFNISLERDMRGLCLILLEIVSDSDMSVLLDDIDIQIRIIELMGGKITIDKEEKKISFTIKMRKGEGES